ncbi:p110 6L [African swine fever virus]|uniref:p110 6L n=1 Tax=African swine fever virus TaxID=10497 RepID=A0A894KS52_ASF|nr:p110 6L [African swine fever virus]
MQFIFFPFLPAVFVWIPRPWLCTIHGMVHTFIYIIHTFIQPTGNQTCFHILILVYYCPIYFVYTSAILAVPAKLATFHVRTPVFVFFHWRILCWTKLSNELSCILAGQKAKNSQKDHQ